MSYLLIQGDARRIPLRDGSVHCVVTSPPYWGLRDYGTGKWEGGDPACNHMETNESRRQKSKASSGLEGSKDTIHMSHQFRGQCGKCGAVRVDRQIGLEISPDEFVNAMVSVFREVRRVLRDDGTLWMNLGDTYATKPIGNTSTFDPKWPNGRNRSEGFRCNRTNRPSEVGVKHKDLLGIPWRVALALQADGWYLRSDIVWHKPNPMPESVSDRPTKSHEYLFLLAKSERYFFDSDAVREEREGYGRSNWNAMQFKGGDVTRNHGGKGDHGKGGGTSSGEGGRNLRTVWSIATEPYPGAHFATYPRKLVEPCIKAGTSEKGCCSTCGAPWTRIVESERVRTRPGLDSKCYDRVTGDELAANDKPWAADRVGNRDPGRHISVRSTVGWEPGCDCGAELVPCVVYDPFSGSGTTLQVADALGRHGVGTDLSREYLGLAQHRLSRPHARVPRQSSDEPALPLFGNVAP